MRLPILRVMVAGVLSAACRPVPADESPVLVLNSGGHTAYIRDVLFAQSTSPGVLLGQPAAASLLTSSYDGTVRQWDPLAGLTQFVYRGPIGSEHLGEVHTAAIHPSQRYLLTGGWFAPERSGRHPVRLYDLSTPRLLRVVHGHEAPVRAIAVSPDGRYVATGDMDGLIRFWSFEIETAQMTPLGAFQGHTDQVTRIAFARVGPPRLVSLGYDTLIRFWSYEGGALQYLTTGNLAGVDAVWTVAPHPTQPVFVIGGNANQTNRVPLGRIGVFTTDGQRRTETVDFAEGVGCVAFSPDGGRLAVGTGYPSSVSYAYVYSWPQAQRLVTYRGHERTVVALTFSPDGQSIASASADDHSVHLWDAATGKQVSLLGSRARGIWSVGFDPTGRKLRWGSHLYRPNEGVPDRELNLRGEFEWQFDLSGPSLTPFRTSEAQRGLLEMGGRRLELLRDPQGGESVRVLPQGGLIRTGRERDKVFGMTFLPSEASRGIPVVIVGTHTCQIYDGLTGAPGLELVGHRSTVTAVAPSPTHPFALTGGEDKTVRLWSVRTGELLLSLFHEGEDWVAWTPTGHYASSPRGERLIGWQINRGEDQPPEFFDGTQFHETLYRPEVIRQLFESGSVAEAIRRAGLQQVAVPDVLPPEVELVQPATRTVESGEAELTITARARSRMPQTPLTSLQLYSDGRPFDGRQGKRSVQPGTTDWITQTWTISVPAGSHEFFVRAATARSHSDSVAVTVKRQQDIQTNRNMYVLGIGISDYADATIDRLFYAARDAEAVCQILEQNGKAVFREIRTLPLTNGRASKTEILNGLRWLKEQMGENDVGVVFYSGHGGVDASFGGFFFLPADIDDEQIPDRGISGDLFKRAIAEIPGRLVVLLDACHAGAVGAGGLPSRELSEEVVHSLTNEQPGIDVICSTDGQSISQESHELQHGYFSYVVVEGLQGLANDRKFDSVVTNFELKAYVDNRLKQITDRQQIPQSGSSSLMESIPLSEDKP
jgi:WD40 repeat protein